MQWWKKESLRIVEIVNGLDLSAVSPQEQIETVKRMGGNVQHFHCMHMDAGLDDKNLFFATSVAKKKNPDILKEYLSMAKGSGIRVVIYFNVHTYKMDFVKQHPDWAQIKEDGNPIDTLYGNTGSFCVNSAYREWVFQILRDLAAYEIDGVFYDGPIFFGNTCYCSSCQKLFREKTGMDLPSKADKQNPLWQKFMDFQTDSISRFLKDSNAILKEINPEILFYMNGNGKGPSWPTGRNNHAIIAHTDILAAEGGFLHGDLNNNPLYKPSVSAKLLSSQAQGKPVVVFDCVGHKPWSLYSLPEKEINLLLTQTLFYDANAWIAVFPNDIKNPEMDMIADFNLFVKSNPDAFYKTLSMAKIALLWPSYSSEVYGGSSVPLSDFTNEVSAQGIGNLDEEFNGFYEGLRNAKYPFDVIDEKGLDAVSKYDLLILPNVANIGSEEVDKIKDFVKKGGNLVATFETSLYDRKGKKKKDFQLAEVFGVNSNNKLLGPLVWDYISAKGKTFLGEEINKDFIPAPEYGISVNPTSGEALAYFCERMAGRYDANPLPSEDPFVTLNQYGKGHALYISGTFGACVAKYNFPEYFKFIESMADSFSTKLVEIKNAPCVEVNLRKKGDAVYIYLSNQTSGIKRPIINIHPLSDLEITVYGICGSSAQSLVNKQELKIKSFNQGCVISLPLLEDYDIICLKE